MRVPTFGLPRAIVPVFYGMFFVEASLGAYSVVWPLWMERLGAEVAIIGLLLSATGFLRVFVVGPSAALADRFGAKRLMVGTRLLVLFGYLGAFIATSWVHLLPVIALMSIAEIMFPLAQSYVAQHSTEEERMHAFTLIFNVGPSVALAAAPLLSGLSVALFGLRSAFLLTAILSAGAFIALRYLDTDAPPITNVSDAPLTSYRSALRQRPVQMLLILQGLMIFSLSLGISFVPTFLEDVRGIDPAVIAVLGAFPAIGSFVFGVVIARNRTIQQRPLFGICIAVMQAMIGLIMFHEFELPAVLWLAFFMRGGFFSGWIMFITALGSASDPRHRSRVFATSEVIGGLSAASGPLIAGLLYAKRAQLPFEISFLLAACLVPILFLVQRRILTRSAERIAV